MMCEFSLTGTSDSVVSTRPFDGSGRRSTVRPQTVTLTSATSSNTFLRRAPVISFDSHSSWLKPTRSASLRVRDFTTEFDADWFVKGTKLYCIGWKTLGVSAACRRKELGHADR